MSAIWPSGVAVTPAGDLWIADGLGARLIRVSGDVVQAVVTFPSLRVALQGVTLVGDDVYVADNGGAVLRIAAAEDVRGVVAGDRGAIVARAPLVAPCAVAVDDQAGWMYVADVGSGVGDGSVWRVSLAAGGSSCGVSPGAVRLGRWRRPSGVILSVDRRRLYVLDELDGERAIDAVLLEDVDVVGEVASLSAARVATIAADAEPQQAPLGQGAALRCGFAASRAGALVADPARCVVWGVNLRSGVVTPVWRAAPGALDRPVSVADDRRHYSLVVADVGNQRLVRIDPTTAVVEVIALRWGPLSSSDDSR